MSKGRGRGLCNLSNMKEWHLGNTGMKYCTMAPLSTTRPTGMLRDVVDMAHSRKGTGTVYDLPHRGASRMSQSAHASASCLFRGTTEEQTTRRWEGILKRRFFIIDLPCERGNSTGIVFKQIKQLPPKEHREDGRQDQPPRHGDTKENHFRKSSKKRLEQPPIRFRKIKKKERIIFSENSINTRGFLHC